MTGIPTIIPNVRRSRSSWRTSLRAIAIVRVSASSRHARRAPRSRRGGDEHVLEARPRATSTCASTPDCDSAARTAAAGSGTFGSTSACRRVPSCATLQSPRHARERRARAADLRASRSRARPRRSAPRARAARPRPRAARRRGSRARGSARPRPCSASRRGSSCRGRPARTATPRTRAGSADRRRWSARRGTSSSGSWISEAASASRCRWPPESVPARWSGAVEAELGEQRVDALRAGARAGSE